MRDWLATLVERLRATREPIVRVVVAATRGSAPRDAGACMLVSAEREWGTIGGGHLELVATQTARGMLAAPPGSTRSDRFSLGASLGQCCGGIVELAFQRYDGADLASLEKMLEARGAAVPGESDLWLFGAGHVGRALVNVLAELPLRITWIDSREAMLPRELPASVRGLYSPYPAEEVKDMPPGAWALVMTHSHDEDLAICEALLAGGHFGRRGGAAARGPRSRRERIHRTRRNGARLVIEAYAWEWLNLLGRAVHVVAGIAWIGASFYFVWLDNHLQPPADPAAQARGVGGELWAVHGGGFYHAQKYLGAPPALPPRLHWFKWEAYTTLLSGLFLLVLIYYLQADLYLVDREVAGLAAPVAVAAGVAWIIGGWLVYDLLCRSPLGARDRGLAGVVALLCAAAAYALCHMFSGRGAFLHFGAMLGTIMVLNVFFVIIPAQRAMVQAVTGGRAPDIARAMRARQRSVHNTYFTLPALFAMISIHYPWVYGAPLNWLWLVAISAAGALVRAYFVARHRGRAPLWMLAAAAAALIATAYGLKPRAVANPWAADPARVQAIVAERCAPCHSATPRFQGITAAPKGIALDDLAQLRKQAPIARPQLASRAMPPGNVTGMTDDERAALIAWIDDPHGK